MRKRILLASLASFAAPAAALDQNDLKACARLPTEAERKACVGVEADPGPEAAAQRRPVAHGLIFTASGVSVRSGTIVTDVGISEQGAPGKVSLSLRTGRYRLTTAPPRPGSIFKGVRRLSGRLSSAQVVQVRGAFARALAEGLVKPVCAAGGVTPRLVIMRPTPTMKLTFKGRTATAPSGLGCWTGSAENLHYLLGTIFNVQARFPR